MPYEQVYEQILSRVDRDELSERCRDVAQKEHRLVTRRIRGATRALQHVYDVDAARRVLPLGRTDRPSTVALVSEIQRIQSKLAVRMSELVVRVSKQPVTSCPQQQQLEHEEAEQTKWKPEPLEGEPEREEEPEYQSVARTRKGRKRRLSLESIDSPRKPPRPGRFAIVDEEQTEEESEPSGPHHMTNTLDRANDDESTEDELPMDLVVLDSDVEAEMAVYLEKARRLRKISSKRRMNELPGLIKTLLGEIKRHEWASMPHDLLGTLSATFGAATTLKPAQQEALCDALDSLRAVARQIDDATARRYPTLRLSTARFLSSVVDLLPDDLASANDEDEEDVDEPFPNLQSSIIEDLHAAALELAKRLDGTDDLKSMEEIEELLTQMDHVFDNPTLARSQPYIGMVTDALRMLIKYVEAIPRTTRRKLQSEEQLHRRLAQLTGLGSVMNPCFSVTFS